MKQKALWIGLALVGALALWMWMRSPRPRVEGVTPDEVAATPQDDGEVAAPRPTDPERELTPDAQPGDDPTPGGGEIDAPEGARALRVVRARTFEPVPEAEVLWWPRAAPGLERTDPLFDWAKRAGTDATLPEGAQALRANSEGVAWLPDARHGVRALARAPGWLGFATFEPGETPPMTIEVQSDLAISVRVVDSLGTPVAGANVAVREDEGPWAAAELRATTGEDGLARIPHFGWAFGAYVPDTTHAWVLLDELSEPLARKHVAIEELAKGPVTLELARGGECEVRIVERDGSPASGRFDVHLAIVSSDDAELEDLHPYWLAGVKRPAVEGGSVLFGNVAIGRRLVANVSREGSLAFQRAVGFGPRSDTERAVIEVRLGQRGATVTGRALDESGAVLADSLLQLRIGPAGGDERYPLGPAQLSGADGRFAFDIETGEWMWSEEFILELALLAADSSELAVAAHAMPSRLQPGEHALGDVVLALNAVFATGRVVDAGGAPIGGARITPSVRRSGEAIGTEEYLEPLERMRPVTDALGRFVLRTPPSYASLELVASKANLSSQPMRVAAGARDVQIVLAPGGEIVGSVLVDANLPLSRLRIVVMPLAAPQSRFDRPLDVPPEADGRFHLRGLDAGEYVVSVRDRNSWVELAQVPGVRVVTGERTEDPRLDPIDLRGRIRAVRLAILDSDGEPFEGEPIVLARRTRQGSEDIEYTQVVEGVATLLLDDGPLAVTVSAEGKVSVHLEKVDTDRSVTLEDAPSLLFTLPLDLEMPQAPVYLGLRLRPTGAAERMVTWGNVEAEFGFERSARCLSSVTGRVKVELHVQFRTEQAWREVALSLKEPIYIDVRERAEQRFELAVPPEALRQAVEAVSRE